MEGIGERFARDVKTGECYNLPSNTTYQQWKEMQEKKYGAGTVDKLQKMGYNEDADRKQFERYKAVIGDLAPSDFSDFQAIKYNDSVAWNHLKYQFRTVNRYEIEGNVPIEKVIKLDNAAWYTKLKGFDYTSLSGSDRREIKKLSRKGNAAAMEFNGKIYFAHSSVNSRNSLEYKAYVGKYELVELSNNRLFEPIDLGDGIPRECDTEAKFLEFVAKQMNPNDEFEISILSEKHICESCQGVVDQFKKRFPKATVNIISGKRGYNGDPEGRKTWKYRKR